MNTAAKLFLLFAVILSLSLTEGQVGNWIGGKYRNPWIQGLYRRFCRNTLCSFGEVCEQQVWPCLIPPCPIEPGCVPTQGTSSKPGACPSPGLVLTRFIQCNTDYGCGGNYVCCHGYRGSECRLPLRAGLFG